MVEAGTVAGSMVAVVDGNMVADGTEVSVGS